ncbi:MAG: transporter [Alphaproteobacteria bacterium]|nr:transporter [Alphaproteobacteria bacterium]
MGAITPIASGLTTLVGALGTANQLAGTIQTLSGNSPQRQEQDLALKQLQERQTLSAAQLAQDNALERERIALQGAQDEDDRRAALRRAVARQRASFGASGISQDSGGSSQAVLLGLFDETETDLAQREQLDTLRNRALDLDSAQNKSLNLLQATQLKQRQDLNRLF